MVVFEFVGVDGNGRLLDCIFTLPCNSCMYGAIGKEAGISDLGVLLTLSFQWTKIISTSCHFLLINHVAIASWT